MSNDIPTLLKVEIESYLNACGLFETLEVFRKEYGVKLERFEDGELLKNKRTGLAKRYFENEKEILKSRQKADHAQTKLAASEKRVNQLILKVAHLKKLCFKHVLFSLELISAIKAKMLSTCPADSTRPKRSFDNKENNLDPEVMLENLVKKAVSIYADENAVQVDQPYFELNNSISSNSPVDNTVTEHSSHHNICSATHISSDFQIIPDQELNNTHPLESNISLANTFDWSASNLIANRARCNSVYEVNTNLTSKNSLKAKECSRLLEKKNLCTPIVKGGTVEKAIDSCYWHETFNEAASSCSSSSYLCDQVKDEKRPGLRKWCEEFLKIPTSPGEHNCVKNEINPFRRDTFHNEMPEDSLETFLKNPTEGNHKKKGRKSYCSGSIERDSLCSFVSYSQKFPDRSDLDTSYAETNFTERTNDHSLTSLISTESNWSKDTLDSAFPCKQQNSEFPNAKYLWAQNTRCHLNVSKFNVEQHADDLELSLKNSIIGSSYKRDAYNDQYAAKGFTSDTYLPKTENKMPDKNDYNTMLDLKTPFRENEIITTDICNSNQGQGWKCDVVSNFTIQNIPRSKMHSKKEFPFPDEDRWWKNARLNSDKSRDCVQRKPELHEFDGCSDLNLFSNQSGVRKSYSINSLKTLNSDVSNESNFQKRDNVHGNACFESSDKPYDAMSLNSSCCSQFKHDPKQDQSFSVTDSRMTQVGRYPADLIQKISRLSESEVYHVGKSSQQRNNSQKRNYSKYGKCFNTNEFLKPTPQISSTCSSSSAASLPGTMDGTIQNRSLNFGLCSNSIKKEMARKERFHSNTSYVTDVCKATQNAQLFPNYRNVFSESCLERKKCNLKRCCQGFTGTDQKDS